MIVLSDLCADEQNCISNENTKQNAYCFNFTTDLLYGYLDQFSLDAPQ